MVVSIFDDLFHKKGPLLVILVLGMIRPSESGSYLLYMTNDLKNDAMTFSKAAEKFGKFLGNDIVTQENSFSYQQTYQDVIDKAGY